MTHYLTKPFGYAAACGFILMTGLLMLVLEPAFASGQVSGKLVNGFRVLDAGQLSASSELVVFRGDYIKFDIGKRSSAVLSVPALDIEKQLIPDLSRTPYFKMKEVGVFDFFINESAGTLTVIEYSGAHYQKVSAKEAREIIRTFNPLVLDVRTPGEYAGGHLEDSILIPVQQLQARAGELADYKEEPILIYCATGNRSTVASKILIDRGFTRIFNLRKGIADWYKKGHPIVK
ncbi:MAG: rhodanese-like domain-containing protein [Desulfobacterales bacterium]|nr:rhodanese-like domain-containing protein [Desulfobacterales bacterium]